MPKGQKNVYVKDLPSGANYKQSNNYAGSGGYGVVRASFPAPTAGDVKYPKGGGSVVTKTK